MPCAFDNSVRALHAAARVSVKIITAESVIDYMVNKFESNEALARPLQFQI